MFTPNNCKKKTVINITSNEILKAMVFLYNPKAVTVTELLFKISDYFATCHFHPINAAMGHNNCAKMKEKRQTQPKVTHMFHTEMSCYNYRHSKDSSV